MKKSFIIIIFFAFFLSGCGRIELNNASVPLAIGSDIKDNKFFISAQMAKPTSPEQSGGGKETPFSVVTAGGKTFSEAVRNTSLYFASVPLWSQVQLSLLSENLAKEGITPMLDFLARNRYARKNNALVITHNASPEQVLNVKPYLESYTAIAIRNLLRIQESQLGIYTPLNTTQLLQRLADPGFEITAPMVTIQKNGKEDQILLDGMAVFKGDKMVGSLDETESRGYHWLQPKYTNGGLFLVHSPLNPDDLITLEISRSLAKTEPVIKGQDIHMKITLEGEGNFYEQSGTDNVFTPEMFNQLDKAADEEIKRQITMCIQKAQTLNSDIFGWGYSIYRADPKAWAVIEADWDQLFPAVPYEIDVKFYVRRSYLTDKPFQFR